MIVGCEACSADAELQFENNLYRLTGFDPSITDYVFEVVARCLQCGAAIHERPSSNGTGKTKCSVRPLSEMPVCQGSGRPALRFTYGHPIKTARLTLRSVIVIRCG
jgi:hypothetical protein